MKKSIVIIAIFLILVVSACKPAPIPTVIVVPTNTESSLAITQAPIPTPTYEPVTLKFNAAKLPSYAPIYLAEEAGYFSQYGISLEPISFNRANEAIPLLASGDLDFYAGALNTGLLNVLGQSQDIKVVADRGSVIPGGCTYQAILVRKDLFEGGAITKPEDLKGQIVASSTAGPAGFLLSSYLAQSGLTLDDVQISDIPTGSYVDGFANKSIAAIVTTELHVTRLLNAGNAVVLARLEDFGAFQLSVLAFGKNLIIDKPEVGARFLAAYLLGVKKYNEGKTDENIRLLAEATGEDPELLRAACWIPIKLDGTINFASVNAFQQWSIQQKQLDNPISEEQFWDPSFLEDANDLLTK